MWGGLGLLNEEKICTRCAALRSSAGSIALSRADVVDVVRGLHGPDAGGDVRPRDERAVVLRGEDVPAARRGGPSVLGSGCGARGASRLSGGREAGRALGLDQLEGAPERVGAAVVLRQLGQLRVLQDGPLRCGAGCALMLAERDERGRCCADARAGLGASAGRRGGGAEVLGTRGYLAAGAPFGRRGRRGARGSAGSPRRPAPRPSRTSTCRRRGSGARGAAESGKAGADQRIWSGGRTSQRRWGSSQGTLDLQS